MPLFVVVVVVVEMLFFDNIFPIQFPNLEVGRGKKVIVIVVFVLLFNFIYKN